MAIFELQSEAIRKIERTTFAEERVTERHDLQRLLRRSIEHISPDTMILAEEFGSFEGSLRRIDLLGLNRDAELVVIELKRTEDGGHIELQAIRYAAMVSAMTFEDAVEAHRKYLDDNSQHGEDPHAGIMKFLGQGAEPLLSETVRIVLAAADFSIEVTTTVLWLNSNGLNISCVRMRPYRLEPGRVLLEVQQVIPLPEAEEYTVKIWKKEAAVRQAVKTQYRDFTRYNASIGGVMHTRLPKRELVYFAVREAIRNGVTPAELRSMISWRSSQLFFQVPEIVDSEKFVHAFKSAGRTDPKRYFYADDRLFHIGGETYALTNQWGDRTLEVVEGIKQRLGPTARIDYSAASE
jgi:hypothetical protein